MGLLIYEFPNFWGNSFLILGNGGGYPQGYHDKRDFAFCGRLWLHRAHGKILERQGGRLRPHPRAQRVKISNFIRRQLKLSVYFKKQIISAIFPPSVSTFSIMVEIFSSSLEMRFWPYGSAIERFLETF